MIISKGEKRTKLKKLFLPKTQRTGSILEAAQKKLNKLVKINTKVSKTQERLQCLHGLESGEPQEFLEIREDN